MLLLFYLILGLIPLLLMLRRIHDVSKRANWLNAVVVGQAAAFLALSLAIRFFISLPVYFLGRYFFIDPLGIYEIIIGSLVFLLAACYSRGYVQGLLHHGEIAARELRLFYAAFCLLLTVVAFAFFSNNLAVFWIFLELTTILSAVLIVTLNAKENVLAALKYVFTASTAMLFSVIGLIILFAMTKHSTGIGTLNWDLLMTGAKDFSPPLFTFAFIFIFVGFAAKAGIVPFHTWLPQAHAKAPSVISVLLSAVLLNIGICGIIRLNAVAHQTSDPKVVSVSLITFGVLSIVVAALSMLPRENAKKLIAFSSIEHMGFILVGIGLGTPLALFWVLFHTMAHALIKTLLFFSAGIMHQQYGSNKFEDMKGAMSLQPLAAWGLIVGSIAIIGLPPFPVFLSKLYILTQLGHYSLVWLAIVLVFFLLVAAAIASILIRALPEKAEKEYEPYRVATSMKLPMVILFAGILVMGVYFPSGFQQMLNGIVKSLGF